MRFSHVPAPAGINTAIRLPLLMSFGDIFSAHAVALRDTMIVGANKAWEIYGVHMAIHQVETPSAVDHHRMYYTFEVSGGSERDLARIYAQDSSAYNGMRSDVPLSMYAVEGDTIRLYTQDLSTGGLSLYSAVLYMNEYDV